MSDVSPIRSVDLLRQLIIQVVLVANFARISEAQIYTPPFKAIEMQATIAPLGEMVTGDFLGHNSVAAICKIEKAIYFFEPDSLENLILANVVSLPDTPIAISKGQEVVLDASDREKRTDKLAVLMSRHTVVLVSFGKDGRPIISQPAAADAYTTDIGAADLEATGKLDVITFGKFCLGVSVARNIGGGKLQEAQLMQGPLGSIPFDAVAFTDFNGDLVPDMAALDWVNHRLLIFYGRGDGTFTQPVSFQLRAEPSTVAVSDLNGNGYPDIIIGYARLNQIDLYGGDGVGRFFLKQTLKTTGPTSKFALADFVGNGTTDIAAFSSKAKQITIFSYDVTTKSFKYDGTVGSGKDFMDIEPFYFDGRFRADLIASSLDQSYIKVFKTSVNFNKSPDILLPVGEDSRFVSACGVDTLNFLVVVDTAGQIKTARYTGPSAKDVDDVDEVESEGRPAFAKLINNDSPKLLLSYENADMVSIYDVFADKKAGRTAVTAYLPFAVDATVNQDSAAIAAAYRDTPDSGIGVSLFNSSTAEGREFIESDYLVEGFKQYLSSSVSIGKNLSLFGVWKNGADSVILDCVFLDEDRTVSVPLQCSDARMLSLKDRYLFVEKNDSVTAFAIVLRKPTSVELHQTFAIPIGSADLATLTISVVDSVLYLSCFDSVHNVVSLYSATQSQSQLVRSWHQEVKPEDVAILPSMKRVYFLNRNESYVSVHNF